MMKTLKRLLLSFAALVLAFSLQPSAFAAVDSTVSGGGSTFGSVVVTLAAGTGAGLGLSNTLARLTNGTIVYLGPGIFSLDQFTTAELTGQAPLKLNGLTNIAIIGQGSGMTRIVSTTTNECDYFVITNCKNVHISGISFEGSPSSQVTVQRGIWTAVIDLLGSAGNVEIDHCRFTGWRGQGIACGAGSGANVGTATNAYIHDNYFFQIGTTNCAIGPDGTAICCHQGWVINNNLIEDSYRGIEFYQMVKDGPGVVIKNNVMNSIWGYGILSGGSTYTTTHDILIEGNTIDGANTTNPSADPPNWPHNGIELASMHRCSILNNHVRNFVANINIVNGSDTTEYIRIQDNTLYNSIYEQIMINRDVASKFMRHILIQGNSMNYAKYTGIEISGGEDVTVQGNLILNCGQTDSLRGGVQIDSPTFSAQTSSNIVISGNTIMSTNSSTSMYNGIVVPFNAWNVDVIDNLIGPCQTALIDFQGSGRIEQTVTNMSIGTAPKTLLSFTAATNAAILTRIEAAGVGTNSFDAANFLLYANWRNTNGFMSNITSSAFHTYIYTNSTDSAFYVDATNAGGRTINFVGAGSSGKNVAWRAKCSALVVRATP